MKEKQALEVYKKIIEQSLAAGMFKDIQSFQIALESLKILTIAVNNISNDEKR